MYLSGLVMYKYLSMVMTNKQRKLPAPENPPIPIKTLHPTLYPSVAFSEDEPPKIPGVTKAKVGNALQKSKNASRATK